MGVFQHRANAKKMQTGGHPNAVSGQTPFVQTILQAKRRRTHFSMPSTAPPQFPGEHNADGEFARQEDSFRDWVSTDASTSYPAAPGRYHLYVSFACPWAHRALIVHHLKNLQEVVGVTVVDPIRDDNGWAFRDGAGHTHDPIEGFRYLREAYLATDPKFRGRWTVPVLWDKDTRRIVNNSEDDICRMFNSVFASKTHGLPDLFPDAIATEQAELSAHIYEDVNNGVYRAGFATAQKPYEHAVRALFVMLDTLEQRLADRRYLFGALPVETDWRLFCTLVRFDAVYHGHFKCNLRRIVDYPNLRGYLQDLYQQPGIAGTVNFDHIKRHYYMTHREINPTGIVPLGPVIDLAKPHTRAGIVSV
jgi:putative glutathione S-transferase